MQFVQMCFIYMLQEIKLILYLRKFRVVCVTRAGLSFENGLRKQKALV